MNEKRYIVLPLEGTRLSDLKSVLPTTRALFSSLQPQKNAATAAVARRLFRGLVPAAPRAQAARKGAAASKSAKKAAKKVPTPALEVLESLGEDGAKLVEATPEIIAALRQQNPGIRIVEDDRCYPALAPRPVLPPRPARAARARVTPAPPLEIEVVRAADGQPVKGADLYVYRTEDDALEGKTNARGKATLRFGVRVSKLSQIIVAHEEPGVWSYRALDVEVRGGQLRIELAPLDPSQSESFRHFHGAGAANDGAGVRVGVIDSGADAGHPDLVGAIEGGVNCVRGSSRGDLDFSPDGAHGTHVAGTIAATGAAPSGIRGAAPGAKLRIYKVFEDGAAGSGHAFAIIKAIEHAIVDQCDIINLSISFEPNVTNPGVSAALRKARNHGILAVAAAGNDYRQEVSFPASDDACVAVSAIGRKGLFPDSAGETGDVTDPFGSDSANFVGGFSNCGEDLDLGGSGVAVVSTFPGGYGVMSGTSMASPAVAGVAARLLSRNAEVMAMPRDSARTDAIRELLVKATNLHGFGNLLEGAGIPK